MATFSRGEGRGALRGKGSLRRNAPEELVHGGARGGRAKGGKLQESVEGRRGVYLKSGRCHLMTVSAKSTS